MVKSVLGTYHSGLRDWVIQRSSAIYMAIYTISLVVYLLAHPYLSYETWHQLFSCMLVKVATILFLLAVLFHAWIGMWTIFTDYIKCSVLRAGLNYVVLLMLFACFFWGLLILWSV